MLHQQLQKSANFISFRFLSDKAEGDSRTLLLMIYFCKQTSMDKAHSIIYSMTGAKVLVITKLRRT